MLRPRGTLHALLSGEEKQLLDADADEAVVKIVDSFKGSCVDLGDTWDAIHRCLSNGTLFVDEGEPPLTYAILGGDPVYGGEDRVVCYVAPEEVKELAPALAGIDEAWLREKYFALDVDEYDGRHGEEDFAATWTAFRGLRDFYRSAASEGRAVVFTVVQTV